jgi:hypothetical protein
LAIDKLDIEAATNYAVAFISDLPRQWVDMEVHTKKRFQKLILPKGISYDKKLGFGTAHLGLIYEINYQFDGNKSSLVDPCLRYSNTSLS